MTSELEQLAALIDSYGLTRLEYEKGDLRVVMERSVVAGGQGVSAPRPNPVSANTTNLTALGVVTVTAPLVGVVYRSHEPGAAPLVERGQRVTEGDVLCIIEAMKLFNEITAPVAGVIDAVLFEDGVLAEYGASLITIRPSAD
jgi:acetyl-CoA carboxylase biotin carboxyl carrier protein